jgi:hypothetical protein
MNKLVANWTIFHQRYPDLPTYVEGGSVALAVGVMLFWSGFYIVVSVELAQQYLFG